jgi:hypothetical protein
MPRLARGAVFNPEELQQARAELASRSADVALGFAAALPADVQDFDFLFSALQDDEANLLPQSADTVGQLKALGRTMEDPGGDDPGDADIPASYTYFGQFVDHDITLEASSFTADQLLADDLVPIGLEEIRANLRNVRTATLELDSVYGPPAPLDPANPAKLLVGTVSSLNGTDKPRLRPPGKATTTTCPASREAATSSMTGRR